MSRWNGDRMGFQSYTKDPTLRLHTFGKLEPMDYPREPRILLRVIAVLGLALGILLWSIL